MVFCGLHSPIILPGAAPLVHWRRHHCCQWDSKPARLLPDLSWDACPCPGFAGTISRMLYLPKAASFAHGILERSCLGLCSLLSSVCGPAEALGACCLPQHSAPDQSLAWNNPPQRLGRWGQEERRGHCVLVSQCEWCGWHSTQSLESSRPLLCKYVHKAMCAPAQDQSKLKILSRPTAASHQIWGKRKGPVSCHNLLRGALCPFSQQRHA